MFWDREKIKEFHKCLQRKVCKYEKKGMVISMRRTKIICTLGPAVDDEKMIKKLIVNGMDCARFNFSHGTHAEQQERMERVRKVSKELGVPVAFLLDTKGPEIRLADFVGGSAMLNTGG